MATLSPMQTNSLKRYVNLEEELKKVYIGQYKKKEKKYGDLSSKTLDRNYFSRIKGSDPRAATCRGKLQSKRSKLNMEINKELMLRSGAENLYKATTNKKMKETVALELSFVNSNLQLLKEQLAELNSSVELYQHGNREAEIPMIPLGLKETKEIDFREPFKDFILEHYAEEGDNYENCIAEFMDIRQAMRTPARDQNGISLLFEHFNQLYYVERRFFPPDRSLGVYFEWYDSLTGVPSCQRTVAFEKAAVLFNIAALYTQIGTRQDRSNQQGLDNAVDNFLRSAGTFQYIYENFTNAPSMDLSPHTLEMLVHLMCAQARECLFEKAELVMNESGSNDLESCLILGQEASHVSEVYTKVHGIISQPPVKDYIPFSWISLAQVKREHYKALAHYFVALGLLDHEGDFNHRAIDLLQFLHEEEEDKALMELRIPTSQDEKQYLGKAHLREALLLHEEAMRVNRMCRELRKKNVLQSILRKTHDRSLNKYASIDQEDDFQEVMDPPSIIPSTQYQLSLAFPDLSQHKVQDLFADLGPIATFNAKNYWSASRTVKLRRRDHQGFGFSVRGDAPVCIAGVDSRSLAEAAGMKEGDFIVGIDQMDLKWSQHDDVVSLIKKSGHSLKLKVVTPLVTPNNNHANKDRNTSTILRGSVSPSSTTSSGSGLSSSGLGAAGVNSYGDSSSSPASSVTSGSTRSEKKSWGIFKKSGSSSSTRQSSNLKEYHYNNNQNIILR